MSAYPQVIGRYVLFEPIASGGMGMIHLGRLHGPHGFSRTVAIKRLHPSCAHNPELVVMLSDEARLAARVEHPNVVRTLDVVSTSDELLVILEFVHGVSLARLWKEREGEPLPTKVVVSIMIGVLYGLHAAHDAVGEGGQRLDIVHRDVSPQNILVGADGNARVLDFGVAKALGRLHTTRDGSIKGKMAYMPVEQLGGKEVDRRADVYAAAVVLWESLTGKRLFARDSEAATVTAVLNDPVSPPSLTRPEIPTALDAIVLRGLDRDRDARYATALEMAAALEGLSLAATPREVAELLRASAAEPLTSLSGAVRAVEAMSVEGENTLETPNPLGDARPLSPSRPALGSSPGAPGEVTTTQHALFTSDSASEPKEIAPAAPVAPARSSRGLVVGIGIVTVACVVLGAAAAVRYRAVHASANEGLAATASNAASIVAPPPVSAGEASSTLAPPAPAPSSEASASASTVAASSEPRAAPPRKRVPTHAPGSAAVSGSKPSCDPPYVVDEAGVRRVKRECIK